MRQWQNIEQLVALILRRAQQQKHVTLTADTAHFIALNLQKVDLKPSRNEVARMVCGGSCEVLCFGCIGKANVICNAYGSSLD